MRQSTGNPIRWVMLCVLCTIGMSLTTCQPGKGQPEPNRMAIGSPPAITKTPSPVMLILEKAQYLRGEEIHFQVVNHLERPIYYQYGCGWTTPFKLKSGERIGLTVNIFEEYPPTNQIAPGETLVCTWDQTAWQDSSQTGRARYQSYLAAEWVPPGRYELGFFYYLNEAEVGFGDRVIAVWSGPFMID